MLRRISGVGCGSSNGSVVLLTRDAHSQGSWLLDLEAALRANGMCTEILCLSSFKGAGQWRCLVNRVSDAAPPADVKIALAAIRACELRGVPVINGSFAYSLGTSKFLHYELFARIGLETPPYVVVRRGDALARIATSSSLKFPLLLKPNAAGFGAGIVHVASAEELDALETTALEQIFGEDGIALLQEFVPPEGGVTYRVFWAGPTVHKGVQVQPLSFSFNACVRSVPHRTWQVPPTVRGAVVKLAALAEADCGSVELLYSRGRELYFDFNLLSTLPSSDDYAVLAHAVEEKCT